MRDPPSKHIRKGYPPPFTKEKHMKENTLKQRSIGHETEEVITFIRLHLYNRGVCCGAQAIQSSLKELNTRPLPSVRTIGRILNRHGLTHGRTGIYSEDHLGETDGEGYVPCNHLLNA